MIRKFNTRRNKKSKLESRIKRLENRLHRKNEEVEDWDFDDMLDEYGSEFLNEEHPDDALIPMDEINEVLEGSSPMDILLSATNGRRYGFKGDPFNPNDEWFLLDAYNNLVSVNDYEVQDYMRDTISENEFKQWCIDQGYVDED